VPIRPGPFPSTPCQPATRQRRGAALPAVFFATIALIGVLATLAIVDRIGGLQRSAEWTVVDCTIIESGVVGRDGPDSLGPYRFELVYRYEFDGQTYESTRWRLGPVAPWDVGPAWDAARRHPPGTTATCLVNPAAPSESVLEHDDIAGLRALMTVSIAIAIAIAGILGVAFSLRRSPTPTDETALLDVRRSNVGNHSIGASCFLLLVASIFMLGGAGAVALFHLRPTLLAQQARGWPEVDCRIVASGVGTDRTVARAPGQATPSRTTSFVDVLYEYRIDGVTHRSSRHRAIRHGMLSSRRAHDIVRSLPPGTITTCRVDPANPRRALLDPSPPPLLGVPAVFAGFATIGFCVVWGTAATIETRRRRARPMRVAAGPDAPAWRSPLVDDGAATGSTKSALPALLIDDTAIVTHAIALPLAAVVVNAAVYLEFVPRLLHAWPTAPITTTLLAVPVLLLAALGVLLLRVACRAMSRACRPRFKLVTSTPHPRMGEPLRVDWECDANGRRVGRVRFELIGSERTGEYGTSAISTAEFASRLAAEFETTTGAESGHFSLVLPQERPTASRRDHAIEWCWRITTTNTAGRESVERVPMAILGPAPPAAS